MKSLYIYLLCLFSMEVMAQPDARWALGDSTYPAGIFPTPCCAFDMTFIGDTFDIQPVVRTFPAIAYLTNVGAPTASSTIANSNGEIQLYHDGYIIRNKDGDTLINGKLQMPANMWNAQGGILTIVFRSVFFLPHPTMLHYYYCIYPYQSFRDYTVYSAPERINSGLIVAEIDANAQDGRGRVLSHTFVSQDTLLQLGVGIVKHGNGTDWWVVTPDYKKNTYYRLLIDSQGVHTYPSQSIGAQPIYDANTSSSAYFSQDGSKFVIDGPDTYKIMDFDRCTGMLSNYREIRGINYGCPKGENNLYIVYSTLSPNNRFLYVSDIGHMGPNCTGVDSMKYNRLYQYDLWDADPALNPIVLMESDATLTTNGTGIIAAPFLTPNEMLVLDYTNTGPNTTFNMVRKPDLKGMACKPLRIPHQSYVHYRFSTLPNYSLGPLVGSPCDTITSVSIGTTGVSPLQVYPNPTQDMLHIHCPYTDATLTLYNALGIEVYRSRITGQDAEVSLAGLGKGVYFLVVKTEDNRIFTEKVRKE